MSSDFQLSSPVPEFFQKKLISLDLMLFLKRTVVVYVHLDNRFFKTLKAGIAFKILEFILALGVESVS